MPVKLVSLSSLTTGKFQRRDNCEEITEVIKSYKVTSVSSSYSLVRPKKTVGSYGKLHGKVSKFSVAKCSKRHN